MKGHPRQDHSPALEGALSKLGGFGNPGPGVNARGRAARSPAFSLALLRNLAK